ncbi:hypothetical protein D7319_05925 [Streptomyces radicis]|uniref:Uncharacterized protein n=1 Tax=Streptomyces radicis TaxID=1750517 RepID=A0A3A9WUJ4_9ACTN|nr:hypothetical protein D7319_05925 [Streptomyces radicis]RKN26505.1 hypothetical protein D7318_03735 [Streptomyces radicis]
MAAAVVALAVVGGASALLLGDDADETTTGEHHRFELPRLTGDFELYESEEMPDDIAGPGGAQEGITAEGGSQGRYSTVPHDAGDDGMEMGLIGVWGEVADPERASDAMFAMFGRLVGDEAPPAGEPERVTPDGLPDEVLLRCQVFDTPEGGTDVGDAERVPVCVWADASTVGVTMFDRFTGAEGAPAPDPVTVAEAAAFTVEARDDALIPRD